MGNMSSSSKCSDSPMLSKYAGEFAEIEKKTKRQKPKSSAEKPPVTSKWNCHFIMSLTIVLPVIDLVKNMKEIGFMGQISCERCKSKFHMTIVKSASRIDECHNVCRNKVVNEKTKKYEKCLTMSSVRRSSWFSKSHLMMWEILLFKYYWWHENPLHYIQRELEWAHQTAVDWANFCREVAIEVILTKSERIGGPGKVVEIGESKFGKRKYHKGKHVEGQWVFGGVERGSNKCFLVSVPNRKRETLLRLIKRWIAPRSIIISDCWAPYNDIWSMPDMDYLHFTVNHSETYRDPESGAHTNSVEGMWHLVKLALPATNRSKGMYLGYLSTFMLHRMWKEHDSFVLFMKEAARLSLLR